MQFCLTFLIALTLAASAAAQDRVILQRENYTGRIAVTGAIEEYNGTELTIRTQKGEVLNRYPAAEVVEIQTAYSEPHNAGVKLLAAGKAVAAAREFDAALKQEQRAWVRREILALLVRCSLRRGDYPGAANRFLVLIRSDPATRHYGLIPLAWLPQPLSPEARDEAKAWLTGTREAAKLIGASFLYDDKELAEPARAAMKELASSTDTRIRPLASAQNWRKEIREQPSELQLIIWQERLEEIPENLRSGPSYLLGRAYAGRHDYEQAAALMLRLPLTDDHDFYLAARASLEAATALSKIGQTGEARALFREVTTRFADTPFAEEAKSLLIRQQTNNDGSSTE